MSRRAGERGQENTGMAWNVSRKINKNESNMVLGAVFVSTFIHYQNKLDLTIVDGCQYHYCIGEEIDIFLKF